MDPDHAFKSLEKFLSDVPGVEGPFGRALEPEGSWWIKFSINIDNPLAWKVVQEFGHVLNYLSLDEPLPTCFKPVSPPPYMNGGPRDYLSWVIECQDKSFAPDDAAKWLKGRLPQPVNDLNEWATDD